MIEECSLTNPRTCSNCKYFYQNLLTIGKSFLTNPHTGLNYKYLYQNLVTIGESSLTNPHTCSNYKYFYQSLLIIEECSLITNPCTCSNCKYFYQNFMRFGLFIIIPIAQLPWFNERIPLPINFNMFNSNKQTHCSHTFNFGRAQKPIFGFLKISNKHEEEIGMRRS